MRSKGDEEVEEHHEGHHLLIKPVEVSTLMKNTNYLFWSKQGRTIKQPAFQKYNCVNYLKQISTIKQPIEVWHRDNFVNMVLYRNYKLITSSASDSRQQQSQPTILPGKI